MEDEKAKNTIVTISGEEVPFKKCKVINGKAYKIGSIKKEDSGDCYVIDNKVLLPDEVVFTKLSLNYGDFQYFEKNNKNVLFGIIGFKNNKSEYGYFKKSIRTSSVVEKDQKEIPLIDINLFMNEKVPYWYDFMLNKFFSILFYNSKRAKKAHITNEIKQKFPYSVNEEYLNKFSKNYEISKQLKFKENTYYRFLNLLFNNTYGFEFETSKGMIPFKYLNETGLMPLRDGSIDGLEYATIPYTGVSGLVNLKKVCNYLDIFTEKDEKCSMHVHIGGLERNVDTILAFLKLVVFTQNEFYKMFPLYKKYHFGYKNKSYAEPYPEFFKILLSQPLDTEDKKLEVFDKIFTYLSQGRTFRSYQNNLNKVINHPADPDGNHKWQIKERYKIVNVIPLIFGNKKTVEFRIHTPTFDFDKLFLFLNIIDSLVVVSNKLANEILKDNSLFRKDSNIFGDLLYYKTQTITNLNQTNSNYFRTLIQDINIYHKQRSRFIADNHLSNVNFPNEDNFHIPYYRMSNILTFINNISYKNDNTEFVEEDEECDNLYYTPPPRHAKIDDAISRLEKEAIMYHKISLKGSRGSITNNFKEPTF